MAHHMKLTSVFVKLRKMCQSSIIFHNDVYRNTSKDGGHLPRHGSSCVWYFCLSMFELSPGYPIYPTLSQECVSPRYLLQSFLSLRSHYLISLFPDGEKFQPPPTAANTHTHMSNHKRCHWVSRSSAACANGHPSFWPYRGLMKVGMDVRGGSEEMPWSARPALNYGPGSDASGAWNRQASRAWDCMRPTSAGVQMDDADAGSSLLTQTCTFPFIGWHFSGRDSSRRLECRGSPTSTQLPQAASC